MGTCWLEVTILEVHPGVSGSIPDMGICWLGVTIPGVHPVVLVLIPDMGTISFLEGRLVLFI